jgi:hypothetical protein
MKTLFAALALASVLVSPAFAQSYDPDLGTGNIARFEATAPSTAAQAAYAQVRPGTAAVRPQARAATSAQSPLTAYGSVTPFGSPTEASAAREKALNECSAAARKYTQTTWSHMELHQYRSCMAQHGQPE